MIKTISILTAEEIQICLVLQVLTQELAVIIAQMELLEKKRLNNRSITS